MSWCARTIKQRFIAHIVEQGEDGVTQATVQDATYLPSHTTIARHLAPDNTFSTVKQQFGLVAQSKSSWSDEEESRLEELIAQGLPRKAVADALGRTRGSVRNKAFKLGLTKQYDRTGNRENDPVPLSEEDESVIWGMVLGDGHVSNAGANAGVKYASVNEDQLWFLKDTLPDDLFSQEGLYEQERGENRQDVYHLRLKHNPALNKFRNGYEHIITSIKPRKDTFDVKITDRKTRLPEGAPLNKHSLLVWYLGDGSRNQDGSSATLASLYPSTDHERVQHHLANHGIDTQLHSYHSAVFNPRIDAFHTETDIEAVTAALQASTPRIEPPHHATSTRLPGLLDQHRLGIYSDNVDAFFDYLPSCPAPSMAYKFPSAQHSGNHNV